MHCPNCKSHTIQKHGAGNTISQAYQRQSCQTIWHLPGFKLMMWATSILLVLGLSPWLLNRLLQTVVVRSDTGETADAIVVLGRGPEYTEYRTDTAVKLWNENRAAHIFVSGITDAPIIIKSAKDRGIPIAHISGEVCSRSTWENALYTGMLIPPPRASSTDKPKFCLLLTIFILPVPP